MILVEVVVVVFEILILTTLYGNRYSFSLVYYLSHIYICISDSEMSTGRSSSECDAQVNCSARPECPY